MKKIYSIILVVLAILTGASCKKQEVPAGPKHIITVEKSNLAIPAKGGVAKIVAKSEDKMEIAIDKKWCSYTVEADTIWVSASQNEGLESRYAALTLTSGKEIVDLTIHQFGFRTSGFAPQDIIASPAASRFVFEYDFDETIEAVTTADWVTLTIFDSKLVVELEENTTQGTPENPARTATIDWVLGIDSGVINITQNNISFMQQDSNWRVYFDGIKPYESYGDAAYIYNEVTDPTQSGSYAIYYTSKDEYIQSGLSMEDYVLSVADVCREELLAMAEYYSMDFSEFLYEDTDFEIFDPMEPGDYIAFALGYDADANITGHYQYADFTVQGGGGGGTTGYKAWIGTWTVSRGGETDTWVITEKVNGQSYNITGIEGISQFAVEATYDSASDCLKLPVQEGVYQQSTSYGTASIGVYGQIEYEGEEYFITGNYDIFTAKRTGEKTASLTPGEVSLDIGDFTLANFLYLGELLDGEYAGQYLSFSETPTALPNTLNLVSGGHGDDPTPPTPSTGYSAWLGEWETVRGSSTDTWKIAALEDGSTYTITGIEGKTYPVTATYVEATQGIEVRAQAEIGTYTSSTYGECSVGFYGGWGESSFATGTYVIFTGSINGNEVTLTPGEVNFSDGTHYVLERAQFVATTSDSKYLTLTKDKTPLPTTLTKKNGGGDNPGGGGSSEGYESWFGKWSITRGGETDTWVISEKVKGKSYNVTGIEGITQVTVEAIYDSASDCLKLPVQEGVYQQSTSYGTASIGIYGQIEYEGEEYFITGDYDIFTAKRTGDKTASLTPGEVSLDIGDFTLANFLYLGELLDGQYAGQYLSFSEIPTALPNTLNFLGSSTSSYSVKGFGDAKAGVVNRHFISVLPESMFCRAYQAVMPANRLVPVRMELNGQNVRRPVKRIKK